MTSQITWADFEKVDMRSGRVLRAEPFEKARKPAYKLWIDFGPLGEKKSSAQLTKHYRPEELVGTTVMAVVNFAPKQVADFMSEVLVVGVIEADGGVVLLRPDRPVEPGLRMA